VILVETIFHSQGGGQPSDTGVIKSSSSEFLVKHATMTKDGIVEHSGEFKGINL
jgi:Ser-tRNA(Ala) deacylase AlaX